MDRWAKAGREWGTLTLKRFLTRKLTETLFGDCWTRTETEAESLLELTEWQARVHRDQEMIVASLLAVPTPLHLCDDWQRMVQEFTGV
jgi:hypothetical protein